MMSIRNADGVLTSQQYSLIFSHGSVVIPGRGDKEKLAVPTTYFFIGGGPSNLLGKPGVNEGTGSYQPGTPLNKTTGYRSDLYDNFKDTVDDLFER